MNHVFYTVLAGFIAFGSLFSTNADAFPAACQALTPAAIQQTITVMNKSLTLAKLDFVKNNPACVDPISPKINREQITIARNELVTIQTDLKATHYDKPYVKNASKSALIYLGAGRAIWNLHTARHWAGISAIYNKTQTARQSVDVTTQALYLLEKLSEKAEICYLDQFAPFNR